MNPQTASLIANIKSLLDELSALDGTPEGTGAINEAMKAFKAFGGDTEREDEDEMEAEKKRRESEEKAEKELESTPSKGVTVNDPAADTFTEMPEETEEGMKEIAKNVLTIAKAMKVVLSRQSVVEKSVAGILRGFGVDKELALVEEARVAKAAAQGAHAFGQNSSSTPLMATTEEMKQILEKSGYSVSKSSINAAAETLGVGHKAELSADAMLAMTHK